LRRIRGKLMSYSSYVLVPIFIIVFVFLIIGIIETITRQTDNSTRRRGYPPEQHLFHFRDQSTIDTSQIETIRVFKPQSYTVQFPPSFEWEDMVDLTPFAPPAIQPDLKSNICYRCGYKNEGDSLFCTQCGSEL
jgi:hypothetical protein